MLFKLRESGPIFEVDGIPDALFLMRMLGADEVEIIPPPLTERAERAIASACEFPGETE